MKDFDDIGKDGGEEKEINLGDDFFMDDAGDDHEDPHDDITSEGEEDEGY